MFISSRFAALACILLVVPSFATPTPDPEAIELISAIELRDEGIESELHASGAIGEALPFLDVSTDSAASIELRDLAELEVDVETSEDHIEARDGSTLTARAQWPQCWKRRPWPQPGRRWCGYKWGEIPWYVIPWDEIEFQYIPWGGIQWYGRRNQWCGGHSPNSRNRRCRPRPPPARVTTVTVTYTPTPTTTSTRTRTRTTTAPPRRTFPPGFIPGAAPPV